MRSPAPEVSNSKAESPGTLSSSRFHTQSCPFSSAAYFNPAAQPPAAPRFFGMRSTVTSGYRPSSISTVPSVDPLSTTMISLSGVVCLNSASICLGRTLTALNVVVMLAIDQLISVSYQSSAYTVLNSLHQPPFNSAQMTAS